MAKKKIRYYEDFDTDFFQVGKKYMLKKNYRYVRKDPLSRFLSSLFYLIALAFSSVYCTLFLRVKFVGAKKLRRQRGGYFIYANHTQPIGDVFDPALATFPKRIYTVVSAANMHLPIIGALLPYLGALPLPDDMAGMRSFRTAIEKRVSDGSPIVIYPEGHLWEYHTEIRPFLEAAFSYPVTMGLPSYSMTATYTKTKHRKKPKMTVYIDGPFFPEGEGRRDMTRDLCNKIKDKMTERSELSTYEYIVYEKVNTRKPFWS